MDISKVGRARTVGPRRRERIVVERRPYEGRFNVLLMTTLAKKDDPLFVQLREANVNADAFLAFIQSAVQYGRVLPGTIVVWDNARIHCANATLAALDQCLAAAGATRANLPAYSPEFNPCENVFAEVKNFLRNNPRPGWSLRDRTIEAVGAVPYENVLAYYRHCATEGLRK